MLVLKKMKIKASIIIRTYNEEDWIGHCLSQIKNRILKIMRLLLIIVALTTLLKLLNHLELKKLSK